MSENIKQFYKEYANSESEFVWVGKGVRGNVKVVGIKYHAPAYEGDAHYVTILYSDGNYRRVFRPDSINS